MPDVVHICCKKKDKCGDGNFMDIHFLIHITRQHEDLSTIETKRNKSV
jgi:hypothetical protein